MQQFASIHKLMLLHHLAQYNIPSTVTVIDRMTSLLPYVW